MHATFLDMFAGGIDGGRWSMADGHGGKRWGRRPRSLPHRVLSLGWGLFIIVVLASYTANLAAFLTRVHMTDWLSTMDKAILNRTKICSSDSYQYELEEKYGGFIRTFEFGDAEIDVETGDVEIDAADFGKIHEKLEEKYKEAATFIFGDLNGDGNIFELYAEDVCQAVILPKSDVDRLGFISDFICDPGGGKRSLVHS